MSCLRSPSKCGCRTHDQDHHRESMIYDDWLLGATCLLGRSSQYRSLPPPANPKWRPNENRRPRRLSSTISNSIRDCASIWQALSQQWQQWNLVQSSSRPPSAIRLLRQSTYPQATRPRKIEPQIQAMYDGRLCARFDYTLEDMGPGIPSCKITVGCYFWWGEECPLIMPTRRPNTHLWATRRDRICRGNWNGWRWTSPWPHRNQSNRWRPRKWWSSLYWPWYRTQSAWQPSKSPCKYRCQITSSWWGGCTTGVQRNHCPQSTSPPRKRQSLLNGCHNQAIMPTTTHESYHKKSGQDLCKCTNHHGKGSRINDQQSTHMSGSNGQYTSLALETSNGRRMYLDSAQ